MELLDIETIPHGGQERQDNNTFCARLSKQLSTECMSAVNSLINTFRYQSRKGHLGVKDRLRWHFVGVDVVEVEAILLAQHGNLSPIAYWKGDQLTLIR